MSPYAVAPEHRFWSKVSAAPDGCWMWKAALTTNGYGSFRVGEGTVKAHRYAWEADRGPVPIGMELDHLCRNRACVRPSHLEPVPHRVNCLRGQGVGAVAAAKEVCPRGHPYSHLDSKGRRHCRTCDNALRSERRHRARSAA